MCISCNHRGSANFFTVEKELHTHQLQNSRWVIGEVLDARPGHERQEIQVLVRRLAEVSVSLCCFIKRAQIIETVERKGINKSRRGENEQLATTRSTFRVKELEGSAVSTPTTSCVPGGAYHCRDVRGFQIRLSFWLLLLCFRRSKSSFNLERYRSKSNTAHTPYANLIVISTADDTFAPSIRTDTHTALLRRQIEASTGLQRNRMCPHAAAS